MRFDFLGCTILAASQAAFNMVIHPEADDLEARLWATRATGNRIPLFSELLPICTQEVTQQCRAVLFRHERRIF